MSQEPLGQKEQGYLSTVGGCLLTLGGGYLCPVRTWLILVLDGINCAESDSRTWPFSSGSRVGRRQVTSVGHLQDLPGSPLCLEKPMAEP